MNTTSRLISIAIVMTAIALTGCRHYYAPANFDRDSVNIATPPRDWPDAEHWTLTPAQQEVLAERGKPEVFRAWWDTRGRLTWGSDLAAQYRRQRVEDIMLYCHHHDLELPFQLSWIYQTEGQSFFQREGQEVFQGVEIYFIDDDRWEEIPLTDQIGVLIDYGDPESREGPEDWRGHVVERWRYYREGKVFHFVDSEISNVEILPSMPLRIIPEM